MQKKYTLAIPSFIVAFYNQSINLVINNNTFVANDDTSKNENTPVNISMVNNDHFNEARPKSLSLQEFLLVTVL